MADGELPEGWARARVGDVLTLLNGFAFKPSHWKEAGFPIIRIQNLNNPRDSRVRCFVEGKCPDDVLQSLNVKGKS